MEAINSLYTTSQAIYSALLEKNDMSEASDAQRILVNYFILCCASSFEEKIKEVLRDFFEHKTNSDKLAINFVAKKAIEREFHKNFDWKSNNANAFFALFGDDFKKEMEKISNNDQEFEKAIANFMSIGSQRNRLVHGNLVAASSGWTLEETQTKAQSAASFVEILHKHLFSYTIQSGCSPAGENA